MEHHKLLLYVIWHILLDAKFLLPQLRIMREQANPAGWSIRPNSELSAAAAAFFTRHCFPRLSPPISEPYKVLFRMINTSVNPPPSSQVERINPMNE